MREKIMELYLTLAFVFGLPVAFWLLTRPRIPKPKNSQVVKSA